MSDVNLSDFKILYISTANEYIQKMKDGLSVLEQDPQNIDAIDSIHISSHSLKSQSLVMGYTTTGELSHAMEVHFRGLHDNNGSLSETMLPLIHEAVQQLSLSLTKIKREGQESNLSELIKKLDKAIKEEGK